MSVGCPTPEDDMVKPNRDSQLYALLIGVDCYLPNQMPDGSYYSNLGGCVHDISSVEDFLKRKLELKGDHILKLTASGKGTQPMEPEERWPTYENMIAAFQQLTDEAKPSDRVYIHYSGHGGRVQTIFPERKGQRGYDEALVPTNIGNSKARYLRDVELVKLLNIMVAKGLVVAVVLDSCHSGGMTRGKGNVAIRGLSTIDTTLRPTESLVATHEELAELITTEQTRNVTLATSWLPEPKGYVLLAACGPSEFAVEAVFEGTERNGALTYCLLDSLQDLGPGLSYKVLHDRILTKIHSRFERQTPQLQGEGDWTVFGSDRVETYYAVPVMQIDQPNRRLLLGAGQAHNLRKGAQFAIYPRGITDFTVLEKRRAVVEITRLGSTDSWATIPEQLDANAIEQGDQAVLLGAGSIRLVGKVALVHQDDLPPTIDQDAALQSVKEALAGNGWVEMAAEGESIDYQVALNQQSEYEIWDQAGQPISNLRPELQISNTSAAETMARRLVHLAKYHATKQLANYDPMSPLARRLVVELIGKQAEYDPADAPEPQPFEDPGRTPTLKEGEWTFVRIRNDSPQVLNVTVLDLQPDWGVQQVYPSGPGDYFVPLDPGQEQILPLQGSLPALYEEGTDTVKVFATTGTTNFRWLELPSLGEQLKRRIEVRSKSPENPLEQLLAAVTADRPHTRHLIPAAYPSWEWVTAQVEVHVQR